MTEEEQQNERQYDELRLLYSISVSDIALFKQQQWKVTNYGLLIYAAIVSIAKFAGRLTQTEYAFLYVAAFVVMATGWYLIALFHKSIRERRSRLVEIRKNFSQTFMHCWRGGEAEDRVPDNVDRPDRKTSLLWFFQVVFGVGFIVVSWLLYKLLCAI